MASSFDRLQELDLSRDEVNRLGEALKTKEFRDLLAEYVEEIQDPDNRRIYEEEVTQIEKERGQEVTFLHPIPGYVIKTSINGDQKCFINICSNDNINKPSSSPTLKDGVKGLQWSLPHSLSPPRDDTDKKGALCQVFDVLFHPDTLHLTSKNRDFCSMVNNIALDAVESNFNVNLDKKNLKFPKMNYKGIKRASLMRKPTKDKPTEKTLEEQQLFNKIYSEIDLQNNSMKGPKRNRIRKNNNSVDNSLYTVPQFVIKHRTHVDIQDFTEHKHAKLNSTVPKELIIEINLPLLKSSSDMTLDVTEKTVRLISEKPAKYKLNITLPYQVNEISGTAKFDKDLKKLSIILPVRRKNIWEPARDDSGVESCIESDLNSPTGPESDADESENIRVIQSSDQHVAQVRTDCSDIKTENRDDFLNSNELYNLPEFTSNVFDNIIAFTFNVKNVDEKTVSKSSSFPDSLIKVKFTSVSSSFYPSCYAFYVKFPQHEIIEEKINVETWDNNVILQVPLKATAHQIVSYLYGTNKGNFVEKFIEEPLALNKALEHKQLPIDEAKPKFTKTRDENISYSDECLSERESLIEENIGQNKSYRKITPLKLKSNAIDILTTSYESSGDELSASSFSPRKSKGILKRISVPRSKFGRSISESSLDDLFCSSFENYHDSIERVPEDAREDEGISSSLKKTVRFNDVVTKQLFRSNSSILGQKKKNQRKARNKKRAHDRRYSESEASDIESKKEGDTQTVGSRTQVENDVLHETASEKKEDTDIFHLEINN